MSDNEQNNGLGMIVAFFAGLTAGAVLGLLYAPSSGEEMRKKIRKTSIDAKNQTVALAQQTLDSIKEGVQPPMDKQQEASVGEEDTTEDTTEAT
ncbi:MAG: YtxH domain-containing protein [Candidatus Poribacteria bacterium]|nr:YtxH domain-containing protein [Candidatus Poribacteria bacterium]